MEVQKKNIPAQCLSDGSEHAPSCKDTAGLPPCVNSVTKDNAGNVVDEITLSSDDPNCS
jgi:hypothetical protein